MGHTKCSFVVLLAPAGTGIRVLTLAFMSLLYAYCALRCHFAFLLPLFSSHFPCYFLQPVLVWFPIAVETVWFLQSQSNHGGRKNMQMAANETECIQLDRSHRAPVSDFTSSAYQTAYLFPGHAPRYTSGKFLSVTYQMTMWPTSLLLAVHVGDERRVSMCEFH